MSEIALECRKLTKVYKKGRKKIEIFNEVDLTVEKGQFAALTGHSGCGKTTLLHLLGTLDKPTSGQIIYFNKDVNKYGPFKKANFRLKEIGFIFQSFHLLPELSAYENLMFAANLNHIPSDQAQKRADELLERVKIDHRKTHLPSELSGGEQQRVAIARALMNDPKVILADEPTGNLDAKNSQDIFALLKDIKDKDNKTIVMVTHDNELAKQADCAFEMLEGCIKKA